LALRVVHTIYGDCDISLQKSRDLVRIHISENSNDPTTFELEGSVDALRDLISSLDTIMTHVGAATEEVN